MSKIQNKTTHMQKIIKQNNILIKKQYYFIYYNLQNNLQSHMKFIFQYTKP